MLTCNITYKNGLKTKNIIFKDFESKNKGLYPIEFDKNNKKYAIELKEKINSFLKLYSFDYYCNIEKEYKLKDNTKIKIEIGFINRFY
jgi:hypothetical protein